MIEIDRSIEPQLKALESIHMPKPESSVLKNGIPVHVFNLGTEDFVKVEILVRAGAKYANNPLVAGFTNQLMSEGTLKKDAETLAEAFDFYGAQFNAMTSNDYASFVLLSMNKYLKETLELVAEVMTEPAMLASEFETLVANREQIFKVNMQKVGNIAKNKFPALLFGEDHPYGNNIKAHHFQNISKEDLVDFYHTHFHANNIEIVVSGKVSDNLLDELNQLFGSAFSTEKKKSDLDIQLTNNPSVHFIEHPGAMQNAFRWGMPMIHKTHEDYAAVRIVNALFGGYFGSRLMKNIREDKGYTYGISSGIVSYEQASYFVIGTEVGSDVSNQAKEEIYKELDILQTELASENELFLVKNFLQGSLMRGFDGPFATAARFKDVHLYGLNYYYFENYLKVLAYMTPEQVRMIANKYFDKDQMVELIVGKN
jgi:predicted Zn-dependent peptidase